MKLSVRANSDKGNDRNLDVFDPRLEGSHIKFASSQNHIERSHIKKNKVVGYTWTEGQ